MSPCPSTPRRRAARLAVLCALLALGAAGPAAALSPPERLSVAVGYFDVTAKRETAAEGRFELTWPRRGALRPFAGVMATSDGGAYAFGGVLWEHDLSPRTYLALSFAPGLYDRGRGKDLGHVVEFRSQVEIGLRLRTGTRLGLAYNHTSNAGLGSRNPGTETLALTLTWPLGVR